MESFPFWAILLLSTSCVTSIPTAELTTRRPSEATIGDTIKQLAGQLIRENNDSSALTFDTRTPPKIKQQIKKPPKREQGTSERSHPGIVEPVSNLDPLWEESTKKLNFYKIENKFTTEHGLSTWVLLNSQTVPPPNVSTTKSTPKPTVKQKFNDNRNLTRTEIFNKITKPLFKKRPVTTTTTKPSNTTTITSPTTPTTEQKLTKIKATILTDAINNKNKTINKNEKENITLSSTTSSPNTTTNDSLPLSLEPKDDEVELLLTPPSKKNKRPSTGTKKKKNKTRRRRPSIDKSTVGNNTKLALKEKPIGTQIYNYLSREIMPTVGVGLVGLMVTAGLASYFLYPFTPVRRSYQVDRKDKESTYYYNDEYTPGGIREEDAIGKVIAGMPTTLDYRGINNKGGYIVNQKANDFGLRRGQSEASVEAIYLTPSKKYSEPQYFPQRRKEPELYNSQFMQKDYVTERGKIHSDVTPVVVPEHGPRNLPKSTTVGEMGEGIVNSRKRRSSDFDNEIFDDDEKVRQPSVEMTTFAAAVPSKPQNFMHTLRLLLEAQIKLGLEFLQKTSQAVAKYFSNVHSRFNEKLNEEHQKTH